MCDPTGGILTAGLMMGAGFAASTVIEDKRREQTNQLMQSQMQQAEQQAKRAEELSKADAIKPRKAKPEEALYGRPDAAGSTSLTGPMGAQSGQIGTNTLLGA